MSKTQRVLNHLEKHGTITSMESFRKFKATRLSDIVFRLRNRGYDIRTVEAKTKDGIRYAIYTYKKRPVATNNESIK